MKKFILGALAGLLVGGIAGYFGGKHIMKNAYEKKTSEEIQKTISEIKSKLHDNNNVNYITPKECALMNEAEKNRLIPPISNVDEKLNAKDLVKDILKNYGNKDDLPFELPKKDEKIEHHNIWDDDIDTGEDDDAIDEEDYPVPPDDSDIAHLDYSKPPYPINKDEYSNDFLEMVEEGQWSKVSLLLFTDNVIAEEKSKNDFVTMSSSEAEAAIGAENLRDFINDKSVGRIFVRNNRLHIDFEIVRSPRSYSSALYRDEDEE